MVSNFKKSYFPLIFFTPIFFINNQWDGVIISYGFDINNLSGVKNWYFESSSNFQFLIIKFLFFVKKITNFSSEFIFDIFTLLSLYLFCNEIKKFFQKIFNFDRYYENYFFIILITFPIWNFITEINLALYVFCFYLAILGYNLFNNKTLYQRFIGIFLMFLSFSIKSNFAFIFAIAFFDFSINYILKKNNLLKNLIFIFSISLIGYLINLNFFKPYGLYEGYNEVFFSSFKLNIKIFLDYLSFFIFYLLFPLIIIYILKIKFLKKFEFFNKKNTLILICIIIFTGISLFPYYLVQKSTDIFNFTDFESRQVFSISVALSFILVFFLNTISKYLSKKILKYLAIFFVIQNLLLLLPSLFMKVNHSKIDTNLANNFSNLEKPKSGYILIINDKIHKNAYNSNFILYRAFGESRWFSKIITSKNFEEDNKDLKMYFSSDKKILKNNDYKFKYAANEFEDQCVTVFEITDDLSNFDLFKKSYLSNQDKYFKVKKLKSKC